MNNLITDKHNKCTFPEYLAMEEKNVERHDFYHGDLFAKAGGTKNHNSIVVNITVFIKTNKKPGSDVYIDGMKLEIEKDKIYVYPYLIYTCQDTLKGDDLYVKNPSIIFEVISEINGIIQS